MHCMMLMRPYLIAIFSILLLYRALLDFLVFASKRYLSGLHQFVRRFLLLFWWQKLKVFELSLKLTVTIGVIVWEIYRLIQLLSSPLATFFVVCFCFCSTCVSRLLIFSATPLSLNLQSWQWPSAFSSLSLHNAYYHLMSRVAYICAKWYRYAGRRSVPKWSATLPVWMIFMAKLVSHLLLSSTETCFRNPCRGCVWLIWYLQGRHPEIEDVNLT